MGRGGSGLVFGVRGLGFEVGVLKSEMFLLDLYFSFRGLFLMLLDLFKRKEREARKGSQRIPDIDQ